MTLSLIRTSPLLLLAVLACGGDEPLSGSDAGAPVVAPDCVIGTLECLCAPSGGCALDDDGEPLQCVAGVCLRPSCPPGTPGCECTARDESCTAGAVCEDGLCTLDGCDEGSENCQCAAGGSCDVGLFCKEGKICVERRGYEGGACLANDTCHPGSRCDRAQGVCLGCELGSQGCHCTERAFCNEGLSCVAGLCAAASDLPPEAPLCFTPCRRDLAQGADTRACDSDGLMAGCIDDQECVQGSCVAPGKAKPSCASDLECPFHQTCLRGGCYSNCEANLDCPAGLGCHRRVCRVPCSLNTGTAACPEAMTCDTTDGETGYCIAVLPPSGDPAPVTQAATFTVKGTDTLELTNLKAEAEVRFTTSGTTSQRLTVRKLSHTLMLPDGSRETIDTPVDKTTGQPLACAGNATECPLWWLELGSGSERTRGDGLQLTLPSGCGDDCPSLRLGNAAGSPGVRYEGRLLVSGPGGTHEIAIRYAEGLSGRWEGQVHYFTDFEDAGLEDWLARTDRSDVTDVDNALVQRWGAFRTGNLEGWGEFEAVLTATRTGSWQQPRVQELCDQVTGGSPDAVCYPFSNPAGVRVFVQNEQASPVPSATTELPIALNLRAREDDPTTFTGRIDSQTALHYPGNPAASLRLAAAPSRPGACDPAISSACVVYIEAFRTEVSVGGRYVSQDGTCRAGYQAVSEPWLVPGFSAGTRQTAEGIVRTECRDAELPFTDDDTLPLNLDLARSNPVPDGLPRRRRLEVLDGALINQTKLFAFVKETFEGFLPGGDPVSAYAFVVLQRSPTELEEEEFEGTPAASAPKNPPPLGMSCRPELLAKLPADVTADPNLLVRTLIKGSAAAAGSFSLDPISAGVMPHQIHYLCDGRFDGGGALEQVLVDPFDGGDPPPDSGYYESPDGAGYVFHLPNPCLPGSELTFFDTGTNFTALDVLQHACQDTATCAQTLNGWQTSGLVVARDPTWRCVDASQALCDVDPTDLREGKEFFRRRDNAPAFSLLGLDPVVNEAFRYKTRFQSDLNRDAEVGFAPVVCAPGTDEYCYDPAEIEAARDRIDCLIDIYTDQITQLDLTVRGELEVFLRANFAASLENNDGFERLYSELLVMLGDEELTQAFASRFDLAGIATRNFDGASFELDGINLSSVAGAEMQRLYTAVQYYQVALDRFYRMGPHLAEALARSDTSTRTNFVSPQTVTLYLARLVRASAQKALAWSEIAKRYRDFNRIELAERVLKRAYAQTYLESAILSQLMLAIAEQTGFSFRDQIQQVLVDAQRTYRIAMLDMRDVFQDIVRGAIYFGFPAAYVPFPAVDTSTTGFGTNGFEVLFNVARQRMQSAKERELVAFESLVGGKLDAAQFQSELTRVRNNHEDQLATLCGMFVGDDGASYPAIERYADRSQLALVTGNPCAMFPNGTIYEQMLEVDGAVSSLEGILTRYRNVRADIESERTRVSLQCGLVRELAQFEYEVGGAVRDLSRDMANTQTAITSVVRGLNVAATTFATYSGCLAAPLPDGKISCGAIATVSGVLGAVGAIAEGAAEVAATQFQFDIANKRLESGRWVTERQCDAQLIDSAARTASMVRSLDEITLEALRAQAQLELQTAQVERSYNEAQRLQERLEGTRQSLVNIEAARSDPNVRIFRNESIINADIAFDDAMRAAYRATRMYEYYTSTSYARLDELFLIRLASRGRPNLEDYLTRLENAFQDFEEQFGLPDARVAILSLRDDILQVPYLSDDGTPLGQSQRIERMQAMLESADHLDGNGYITIPFGTSLTELSPLTRNHKIRYIEANVIGSVVGDRLGRVYLRQRGTSVLRTVEDRTDFYVFPERTAVVDVFFNGNRVFPPEVYQNLRLRDRPYSQTMWELVINQRDEQVNRDIDLGSLSDIQLIIHYTDFTVF